MEKMENDKKSVGGEFEEVTETDKEELRGLFDLVLPPGLPHKIIMEAVDKFNLEVTTRKVALKTIDIDKENLLVLRGKLDDVNNAHDYIYQKLNERYK